MPSEKGPRTLLGDKALQNPYPLYTYLRNMRPVHYLEDQDLWVVTKYRDCVYVLEHPNLFSSEESISNYHSFHNNDEARRILRRSRAYPLVPTLILTDPPQHSRYRKITRQAFISERTGKTLESFMLDLTSSLLDKFSESGKCEFIKEFACHVPTQVLGEILDVDQENRSKLRALSEGLIALQAGDRNPDRAISVAQVILDLEDYFIPRIEQCQYGQPRNDFLGRLTYGLADENPLELQEILALVNQIIVAGVDTTTHFLGNIAYLLAENSDLASRIREDLGLIPAFVDEALRLQSSVHGLFRTTTTGVEINGTAIPSKARLLILFASANRDEEFFDQDFSPCNRRRSPRDIPFGHGIHQCLGRAIARRQGRVVVDRVVNRLRNLRIDPSNPPVHTRLFGFHGFDELYLRFTPTFRGGRT